MILILLSNKMEELVIDVVVKAVILAVRKDLIKCLMDTECCRWSKRRIRKIAERLQKNADDEESIQEAVVTVKEAILNMDNAIEDKKKEEDENRPEIYKFVRKLSRSITLV